MNRNSCIAAFVVGALVVLWVGAGYVGKHPLALAMTALIGAAYALGARELWRYRAATGSLSRALATLPEPLPDLDTWLATLHPALQNPVRLRIEGERVGLPGPTLTPYLVGLLVMLGMLGTFLGMVVTLNGAVLALESTTDLATLRATLAAPVKGLGLAFGTSVAGVAASAMLGLISTLCRHERLAAGQQLDSRIASSLRRFSQAHQRQETLQAIQSQAQSLPAVANRLQAMMAQMERQTEALNDRLLGNQTQFNENLHAVYATLAQQVGTTLQTSLAESARVAGATLQPVAEATLAAMARETAALHTHLSETVQNQLTALSTRFAASTADIAGSWGEALARHENTSEALARSLQTSLDAHAERHAERSVAHLNALQAAQATTLAEQAEHETARSAALHVALAELATRLQHAWSEAGALTLAQQQQICVTLDATARDLIAHTTTQTAHLVGEVTRLIDVAAEAPRAAADVIAELRQERTEHLTRDNDLLDERARILTTLATLLETIHQAAHEQRSAIDALVATAATRLEHTAARFAEQTAAGSAGMHELAAQLGSSAVEVGSLGEAFTQAARQFGEANVQMLGQLQRIETALEQAMTRSDEQLAYTVAQARELIDLSLMSQQRLVADLRGADSPSRTPPGEVG